MFVKGLCDVPLCFVFIIVLIISRFFLTVLVGGYHWVLILNNYKGRTLCSHGLIYMPGLGSVWGLQSLFSLRFQPSILDFPEWLRWRWQRLWGWAGSGVIISCGKNISLISRQQVAPSNDCRWVQICGVLGSFFLEQLFWSVNFLHSTIDGERSEGVSISGWMGGYVMRYINIEIFLGSVSLVQQMTLGWCLKQRHLSTACRSSCRLLGCRGGSCGRGSCWLGSCGSWWEWNWTGPRGRGRRGRHNFLHNTVTPRRDLGGSWDFCAAFFLTCRWAAARLAAHCWSSSRGSPWSCWRSWGGSWSWGFLWGSPAVRVVSGPRQRRGPHHSLHLMHHHYGVHQLLRRFKARVDVVEQCFFVYQNILDCVCVRQGIKNGQDRSKSRLLE